MIYAVTSDGNRHGPFSEPGLLSWLSSGDYPAGVINVTTMRVLGRSEEVAGGSLPPSAASSDRPGARSLEAIDPGRFS